MYLHVEVTYIKIYCGCKENVTSNETLVWVLNSQGKLKSRDGGHAENLFIAITWSMKELIRK